MIKRRDFIKSSAATISAAFFSPALFTYPEGKKLENFGFISGIIGKELDGDWRAVLRQAASYGFTEIETGNYIGESAESFLAYLESIGMRLPVGGLSFLLRDVLHDI